MTSSLKLERSPVHVVYGGAHRYKHDTPQKLGSIAVANLRSYASDAPDLSRTLGISGSSELIETVYERTRLKLQSEPVEDFRIDFEDGYGVRPDREEDEHAQTAAHELARSFRDGLCTPFTGLRVKSFAAATRARAERTLSIFISTLIESTGGKLPEQFCVTLPKVSSPAEVADLVDQISKIEAENNLDPNTISIEIMIETPSAIFDANGNAALPAIIAAAQGRCRSAHFGAYDYTAALGISARHQGLRHSSCEFARNVMLATLSPLGVRLVDSITPEIPTPAHRGIDLTEEQKQDNLKSIQRSWKLHFDNVLYSMSNGFYQSWDLHPSQLIPRFAAVNYFYLDGFREQAERLKNYAQSAAQAALTGSVFDDAASARGVVNFFLRGLNCGALDATEIQAATGVDSHQLASMF